MKAFLVKNYFLNLLLILALLLAWPSLDWTSLEPATQVTTVFVILTGLLSWATIGELAKLAPVAAEE